MSIPILRWQARRFLARLRHELAEAGLPEAGTIPGVAAMVDQHAAAVRDRVAAGLEWSAAAARPVLLASYAGGVLDAARAGGWPGPSRGEGGDGSRVDWTSLRLLAVCVLADRVEVGLPDLPPLGGQERYAA